jgi:hypothetical protein
MMLNGRRMGVSGGFMGEIVPGQDHLSLTHTETCKYAPRSQVPEEVTHLLIAILLMCTCIVLVLYKIAKVEGGKSLNWQ